MIPYLSLVSQVLTRASRDNTASPGTLIVAGVAFCSAGTYGLIFRKRSSERAAARMERWFHTTSMPYAMYIVNFIVIPIIFVVAGLAAFVNGLLRL